MNLKPPLILVAALCCHAWTWAAPQESSQETLLTSTNVLTLKSAYESTNGVLNFRNFNVEVLESGNYYAEFWLQPARYADGGYTTFEIYVNGNHAGTITPTDGNWQSAGIEDSPGIALSSGSNVISVATPLPEVPAVESVRLSRNGSAVAFSSTAYDAFMQEAKNPSKYSIAGSSPMTALAETYNSTQENSSTLFMNVPLKYSFFKSFFFQKGHDISLLSSSDKEHVIDVFLYEKRNFNFGGTNMPNSANETSSLPIYRDSIPPGLPDSMKTDIDSLVYKPIDNIRFIRISPEEIQGLNWRFPSEQAVNSNSKHIAKAILTIPQTGIYIIKLRSIDNGMLSTADITVNGKYFYEDEPIYYSGVDCEIPADGNVYRASAYSETEQIDPMLFAEGAGAQRIVGINSSAYYLYPNNLNSDNNSDAYITQAYLFKATGLHVCNYSSSAPESTCNIIVNPVGTPSESQPQLRTMTADAPGLEMADNHVTVSPNPAYGESSVTISSTEGISSIDAYGIAGSHVASVPVSGHRVTIPLADLGIHEAGIYVLNITTTDGEISTHNIIVK